MNKAILQADVQKFIRDHLDEDLSKIILKGSPFSQVSIQEIAIQISGLQRSKNKLPKWFENQKVIFPPNINLEQTSSEITAKYKASLVSGKNLIDLTGGFGIDTFYFAESFKEVTHCEINKELSEIASHNFSVLQKRNITTYCGDGIEYLKNSTESFDCIYLDPARRDDYGGKVFLLEQCTPNIPEHLEFLFTKTNQILIKTSPLLDLTAGMRKLEKVAEIHILSVDNEVKELVWFLKRHGTEKTLIKTVNFQKSGIQEFQAELHLEKSDAPLSFPKKYLYEPNAAVMKSGLFAEVAIQTGTSKLHSNSHLYTSDALLDFPGRSFTIQKVLPYSKKHLRRELSLKKANIATRNFPKSVEDLRKELKIQDGGEHYLFFSTNPENEKIVLLCSRI